MVPRFGCTASWPPSSLPIAHGDPTSPGAAVGELLRPLRCTLPIGWIGGRYTTSNPISAMRGRSAAAVAKVPCTALPSASQPPVERGNISYHEPKRASGRSTQTPNCSPRVTISRSGYAPSNSSISGASASAVRVTGSPGVRNAAAAASSGSRPRPRHTGGGALEQCGADQQVVGQFSLALAGVQLGDQPVPPGVNRVTPPVDPEGPQTDPVGRELTVEDVGFQAHRHGQRQRLDPLGRDWSLARTPAFGGLHRLDPAGLGRPADSAARGSAPPGSPRRHRGLLATPRR